MEDVTHELLRKAAEAHDSVSALQFSQAACNAANALRCLRDTPKLPPEEAE